MSLLRQRGAAVAIITIIFVLFLLLMTNLGVLAAVKTVSYSPIGGAFFGGGGGSEGGADFGTVVGDSAYPITPPIKTTASLHYCTIKRPSKCGVPGHGKFHNTTSPMGDAIDLVSDGGGNGIFAVFDGTAEIRSSGKLRNIRLHSKDNPGVFAIYAHINNGVSGPVEKGQKIGNYLVISGSVYKHLHFEMWVSNNQSIVGDQNIPASQATKYCRSIWENIAAYLKLDPQLAN